MNTYFQKRAFKRAAVAVGATLSSLALVGVAGSPAAFAAEGDVDVTNTETVQVYLDSHGKVQSRRVYEQLTLTGVGTADIANPIETNGLRNLDGFSGFDVEDGVQQLSVDVDGVKRLRSVSDYSGELPLQVSIEYRLDGEVVSPDDVVGADGAFEVIYTVKNVTAAPQEITYPDGKGGTITENAEVPVPMVGSLTTIAPANFTDVQSSGANMAGDGKGGTKLSFTMTLFPPLGSDEVSFGYTANISDGVVPAASISALPVNPLESPTFKTAGESYKSGSETGAKLANGATEIDSNLLKLRDGAADLLGGLIKLSDGADELNAGLAGKAAPGAEQLASGALRLDDGLGELDDGAGRLADGAGRANAGSKDLADGAGRLKAGLGDLNGGVGDLDAGASELSAGQTALVDGLRELRAGVDALPASVQEKLAKDPQYGAFLSALGAIAMGVGTLDDGPLTESLLGGLKKLEYGLDNPLSTPAACEAGDASLCGVTDALEHIGAKLFGAINGPASAPGTVAALKAGILSIKTPPPGYPGAWCDAGCQQYVDGLAAKVEGDQKAALTTLRTGVLGISTGIHQQVLADGAGLDRLRAGLSTGVNPATCQANPDSCGIREAALFLQEYGVPALVAGITEGIRAEFLAGIGNASPDCDPEKTLLCGASALADGGNELTSGIDKLVAGVVKLNDGGALLATGAGDLSNGLNELADGAGRLADGTGEARDGSEQLADGAGRLSEGLGDAADGSGRLADGLDQAEEGAPKIVDGAGMLSTAGMSQLIDAGKATAQDYGKLYAVIGAAGDRAESEKMAYGAPENAQGLTAYTFELVGNDGEGGRNTTRGLLALGLLGLGLGAFALRRRLI